MKAKWCITCEKVISGRYKRCPVCASDTIQDVEQLIKDQQIRNKQLQDKNSHY